MPNTQAGGPPLVGRLRLLIQYIHSYPPYLEAVSSIHNLRMRYAMVTRHPPNVGYNQLKCKNGNFISYNCQTYCCNKTVLISTPSSNFSEMATERTFFPKLGKP
jgi:hypothetical protein